MFDKVLDEKTIQVSLVSGIVFFLLSNQPVLKFVEDLLKKFLNIRLSGNALLLLHSVVFAVLVGVISFYVYQPLRPHLRGLFHLEGQNMCDPGYTMDADGECVADAGAASALTTDPNALPKNTSPGMPCVAKGTLDPETGEPIPGAGNAQCMTEIGEICAGTVCKVPDNQAPPPMEEPPIIQP